MDVEVGLLVDVDDAESVTTRAVVPDEVEVDRTCDFELCVEGELAVVDCEARLVDGVEAPGADVIPGAIEPSGGA